MDQDTKGIPGSPPVAETIFRKISECSVFVPDLTFVGITEKKRPMPNPNVLVEYGWALSNCGHARIVALANTAYGELSTESVPFDIRHHRWPITYHLASGTDAERREKVKGELVAKLCEEIRSVLATPRPKPAVPAFEPLRPKSRISSFLDEGDFLCKLIPFGDRKNASDIIWHDGPQIFLRVIPQVPAPKRTPMQLRELIGANGLRLFGRIGGVWTEGNEWGAVTFNAQDDAMQNTADSIVQVTDHGEIWSIDGSTLRKNESVPFLEPMLASLLGHYLTFANEKLAIPSNVKVITGLTGIRGRDIWRPLLPKGLEYRDHGRTWGTAVKDQIVFEVDDISLVPYGEIKLEVHPDSQYRLDDPIVRYAYKILLPYFEQLCGLFQVERLETLPR